MYAKVNAVMVQIDAKLIHLVDELQDQLFKLAHALPQVVTLKRFASLVANAIHELDKARVHGAANLEQLKRLLRFHAQLGFLCLLLDGVAAANSFEFSGRLLLQ